MSKGINAFLASVSTSCCFFLIICILSACAAHTTGEENIEPAAAERKFRVSVTAGGKRIDTPGEELVHRIYLNADSVHAFVKSGKKLKEPLVAHVEEDDKGRVIGVRVAQFSPLSALGKLGLKEGDVVTAVGKNLVQKPDDVLQVFDELDREKHGSITVERRGKPHKILINLKSPASKQVE